MLNRSASLAMSTSILEALPGKLDISKRHSPSILYFAGVWYACFYLLAELVQSPLKVIGVIDEFPIDTINMHTLLSAHLVPRL